MKRERLPRSVKVPVLRRKIGSMGLSKKHLWRRIEIERGLRGVVALATLVHESLHQIDHRLSERTVRQLEKALVFLVIDNPDVFRTLYKKLT